MQQTERYEFNLIEPGDAFGPEPLNENMRRLDGALIRCGQYTGDGTNDRTVALDFKPKLLFLFTESSGYYTLYILTREIAFLTTTDSGLKRSDYVTLGDKGIRLQYVNGNSDGKTNYWFAFP